MARAAPDSDDTFTKSPGALCAETPDREPEKARLGELCPLSEKRERAQLLPKLLLLSCKGLCGELSSARRLFFFRETRTHPSETQVPDHSLSGVA